MEIIGNNQIKDFKMAKNSYQPQSEFTVWITSYTNLAGSNILSSKK